LVKTNGFDLFLTEAHITDDRVLTISAALPV
jgi:hypothetical protein